MINLNNLSESDQRDLIGRKAAKEKLIDFCVVVDPRYQVNWHHIRIAEKLESALERVMRGEKVRIILELPPRHGKKLTNDVIIPTPNGFKRHGELEIGDRVYSPSGKPVKVLGVLNVSEKADCDMRVWFSGNIYIDCHREHEWKVYDRGQQKYRILETQEINALDYYKDNRCRFQIDYTKPIEGKDNFNLHPYLLGVWLGDGGTKENRIARHKMDVEHIGRIKKLGYIISSEYIQKGTGVVYSYVKNLQNLLKKEGIKFKKFIPDKYLFASEESRRELLRGLIDTDGAVGNDKRVRFVNTNKELIFGVKVLIESLGYRTCISFQKACISTSGIVGKKDVYTVSFSPYDKKRQAYILRKNKECSAVKRKRGIINIEQIIPKKGKCIEVEGGLYLATEYFIPTHNSELATIKFPGWCLGKYPDLPVIVSSYSADLANDFGLKTRDLMNEPNYQAVFDTRLRADVKAKSKWLTQKGGGYTATGVGGAITGRGFKIGIIDDPLKNREEANSEVYREKIWNWYLSTFYTRQDGVGAIIVIMTRWHLNDLVGRLREQQKEAEKKGLKNYDKWEAIRFPAIAEKDGHYRKAGEALWPDRFSIDALDGIRNTLGVFEFSALYQQQPISSENQEFKKKYFTYYEEGDIIKKTLKLTTTIDPAISEKKEGHNSVITTVGKEVDKPEWYVREESAGRMNPRQLVDAVFYHYKKYRSEIWLETIAYQKSLKYWIEEEMKRRGEYFTINELKTNRTTNKETRIRGLLPMYEMGLIKHKHSMVELENEELQFPKGRLDDRVDNLASQLEAVKGTIDTKKYKQPDRPTFSEYEGKL